MKIFFAKDIKLIDDLTIEEQKITSFELMERAAGALADEITARWTRHTPIVVFAGPGNNGGDALAVAGLLAKSGYQTTAYLFNPKGEVSPNCKKFRVALEQIEGAKFHEVCKEFIPPTLTAQTLVIDGLFGTGLSTPIAGGFASVIQYINSSEASVVAIDIPSGLYGEDNSNNSNRNIIRAQTTLTFQFPKLSFMFAENEKYTGEVVVLDIQLSEQAMEQVATPFILTEKYDAKQLLNHRSRFVHKGNFGHALLVSGSFGMMGASLLAARACMHAGVGMLTVHGPEHGFTTLQLGIPEAKFQPDKDPRIITHIPNVTDFTNVAFGPGIGTDKRTAKAIYELIKQLRRPCVIDADGLNILAENPEWIQTLPSYSIMTPHIREFDRLFGESANNYERLRKGIEAAQKHTLIVIIKGANTAICTPSGYVLFNTSGNPGMATGGCGDVLTGILLSLLAQNYRPEQASVLGVYIHGMAADIALTVSSEEALLASDIIANLGHAFRQLRLS